MLTALPLVLNLAPEIARLLGGSQAATVTAAAAAAVRQVAGTDDPDAAAATLAADPGKAAELRVALAKIAADAEAAQRQVDLDELKTTLAADADRRQADLDDLKLRMADLSSARAANLDLAKAGGTMAWAAPVLSGIILLAFAGLVFTVVHLKDSITNEPLANVMLGTLAAMATQVANYWLGSSLGSSRKDVLLQHGQDRLASLVQGSAPGVLGNPMSMARVAPGVLGVEPPASVRARS